jgi:dihydroorotate dehydrogenase electron transfer subunit
LKDCRGVIVENDRAAEGLRRAVIELDGGFPAPEPGQFVNLRLEEVTDPLLRRPFSVYSFQAGIPAYLGILYASVGRWTRLLAASGNGARIDVLGPLGSAFRIGDEARSILVAGGRGVAPLIFLSGALSARRRDFVSLVGARGEGDLYWEGATEEGRLMFATEDGSAGKRGLVTDLLGPAIAEAEGRAAVYCCGPVKMLRAVGEMCADRGVPCQASVETVFACGVGVCRGCTVPARTSDTGYLMACSDGPVLRAETIDWELFAP